MIQDYLKSEVKTFNQIELIILLYEKAISCIKNNDIIRFQKIIAYLDECLDFDKGKEISNNLHRLYAYMQEKSIESNCKENIIDILKILMSGWEQIKTTEQPINRLPSNIYY